jgi:transcription elongation GreA/GreB family factor
MADDLTIQAGVRSSGGAAPNIGELPPSRTADALAGLSGFAKVANNLLAPVIEREKNVAFVNGITAVMQGRTAEEVVNEQPAWARTFGDNYAVQGARMQEAASAGTRFAIGVQQQMPELRKLSQDQFSRHVADNLEKNLPTDPQAAMLAKQRIVQSLPDLTTQWARANTQWKQEDALVKHTEGVNAEVGLFKSSEEAKRLNPAQVDPATDDLAAAQFQAALSLPPGVDPAAHERVVHKALVGAAGSQGGVAFYSSIKARGMFDALDQDVQHQVLRAATVTARADVEARLFTQHPELVNEAASLRAEAYKHDVPTIMQKAQELNVKTAKTMGIPQELWQQFSTTEMETLLKNRESKLLSVADAEARRQERAADAAQARQERRAEASHDRALRAAERRADKAEVEANRLAEVRSAMGDTTPGGFGSYLKATSTPRRIVNAVNADMLTRFDVSADAPGSQGWEDKQDGLATYLTRLVGPNGMEPPPQVENITRLALASSTFTPQVQRAVDVLSRIKDPSTVARLISGDQKRSIDAYRSLVQQNTTVAKDGTTKFTGDRNSLWLQAQATAVRPPKVSGGEDGLAKAEELQALAGFDTPLMNGILKREYDERHDLPEDQRLQAAVVAVQGKAYSAGGVVVQLADPSINPAGGFTKAGGMPPKAQAAGMKPLLAGWAKKFDATSPPTVYRTHDEKGIAQFIAIYDTPNGTQTQRFTGAMVRVSENSARLPSSDPESTRQKGRIVKSQVYVAPGQ